IQPITRKSGLRRQKQLLATFCGVLSQRTGHGALSGHLCPVNQGASPLSMRNSPASCAATACRGGIAMLHVARKAMEDDDVGSLLEGPDGRRRLRDAVGLLFLLPQRRLGAADESVLRRARRPGRRGADVYRGVRHSAGRPSVWTGDAGESVALILKG